MRIVKAKKNEKNETMMGPEPNYKEYQREEAVDFVTERYAKAWEEYRNREVKERYGLDASHLTDVIKCYAGNEFKAINRYLRKIKTGLWDQNQMNMNFFQTEDTVNLIKAKAEIINEEIETTAPLDTSVVVYRRLKEEDASNIIAQARREGKYIERGFLSTTMVYDCLPEIEVEGKSVFKIYVPKGVKAYGIDGIANRDEYELLFPTDCILKYRGDEEVEDGMVAHTFYLSQERESSQNG